MSDDRVTVIRSDLQRVVDEYGHFLKYRDHNDILFVLGTDAVLLSVSRKAIEELIYAYYDSGEDETPGTERQVADAVANLRNAVFEVVK
jgi:hypothetical protein